MIRSIVQKCNTSLQPYKDEETRIILQRLKKNHGASISINWESIEVMADILYPAIQGGILHDC